MYEISAEAPHAHCASVVLLRSAHIYDMCTFAIILMLRLVQPLAGHPQNKPLTDTLLLRYFCQRRTDHMQCQLLLLF